MSEGDRYVGMTVAEIAGEKPRPKASAYAIGSDHLPGLSKLIEEIGEVGQVAGKIIGLGHMGDHWDGSNLKVRLEEEIADLTAAMAFFVKVNGLDDDAIGERIEAKIALFEKWHAA